MGPVVDLDVEKVKQHKNRIDYSSVVTARKALVEFRADPDTVGARRAASTREASKGQIQRKKVDNNKE